MGAVGCAQGEAGTTLVGLRAAKEADKDGRSEATQDAIEDADAQGPLAGRGPDLLRLPSVPSAETSSQGVSELRLLCRTPGHRNRVGLR